MSETLTMSGAQHAALKNHLFPGDGKEAVALLLCGRRRGARHKLLVHDVIIVPHGVCKREPDRVTWPTMTIEPLLRRATSEAFAIVKIHSHPGGFADFSPIDDDADRDLFASVYGWVGSPEPHGSAVMLPDGTVFGRTVTEDGTFQPWASVVVAGDDLRFFHRESPEQLPAHTAALAQAFGRRTVAALRGLKVAVVGCSGTGSLVIEQLARNGVGELMLIDPDSIERRNLNRIVNAQKKHVGQFKVDVLKSAIDDMELGTKVSVFRKNVLDPEVVCAVADCDVVFGCVDGVEGRHCINRIASYYLLPYVDVGVRVDVEPDGSIFGVEAAAHYVVPGGSSLLSRGLYTMEQVGAESLKRSNPEEYERRRALGYIPLVGEGRPAVISINMVAAAMGVNELIARLNPYRDVENTRCHRHIHSLYLSVLTTDRFAQPCPVFARLAGRGDTSPLLDMPALSENK